MRLRCFLDLRQELGRSTRRRASLTR
ncbi:hypothetical protein ACIHAR_01985 [Streptomyces sp. NPDC052016]